MSFEDLPKQTQSKLANLSAAVEGVVPIEVKSWVIDLSSLSVEGGELDIIQKISSWAEKSKKCLYIFQCDTDDVDLSEVERAFAFAKAHEDNNRSYPRLNKKRSCFYVGSSQSIARRFKEHLGYGAPKTFALNLCHWAGSLPVTLSFLCAKYADDTPAEVMHVLEDTLWESLKPMFGRQGQK